MLVRVARGPTILLEECVVFGVGNYLDCHSPMNLKPLRPFPPLGEMDIGFHPTAITPPAIARRIIVRFHKAMDGFREILVNGLEIVNRYTALREKNKALV